jgi:hypothetical protein
MVAVTAPAIRGEPGLCESLARHSRAAERPATPSPTMDALAARVASIPAAKGLLDALRGLPAGCNVDGLATHIAATLAAVATGA